MLRPRLHEQIKRSLFAQILDPYEVAPDKFAQINVVLFAHVNATLIELPRPNLKYTNTKTMRIRVATITRIREPLIAGSFMILRKNLPIHESVGN